MTCTTGVGAAFGLDRSEFSFVRSVITNPQLQVYSIFRDLHHIHCARSVLLTVVLRLRRAHSACEVTGSARNERINRWILQDSKIIAAGLDPSSRIQFPL
ncbi:unnamed protein product [Albugo candida]|uniref:Uncharacterized protein n=1 Tax=Albugo candida TaxID=65357 RepID=A0A024FUU1_9STRA|nr:unnamed protein product [Albugo candida]|eukprot:CCI10890.1 unnamed protein product [Albugo candida]